MEIAWAFGISEEEVELILELCPDTEAITNDYDITIGGTDE